MNYKIIESAFQNILHLCHVGVEINLRSSPLTMLSIFELNSSNFYFILFPEHKMLKSW